MVCLKVQVAICWGWSVDRLRKALLKVLPRLRGTPGSLVPLAGSPRAILGDLPNFPGGSSDGSLRFICVIFNRLRRPPEIYRLDAGPA